jgi:mannose-6-phosphate isomerase class I
VQLQLSSGAINVRVRRLDQNDDFEVDTPNLAFTISQPGSYRLDASEDGTYTVVCLRDGGGEATGNGQTYTLHAGQQRHVQRN